MQLDLIARTDDLQAALDGFAHVANSWQSSMGDVYTGLGVNTLGAWLARLGYHDGAALDPSSSANLARQLIAQVRADHQLMGEHVPHPHVAGSPPQ